LKALVDRPRALTDGLAAIRTQFQLPAQFPMDAEAEAAAAVARPRSDHVGRYRRSPGGSTEMQVVRLLRHLPGRECGAGEEGT